MKKQRHWVLPKSKDLSYSKAHALMKDGLEFATRPEWKGFHFYNSKGEYCIFFEDGHIEVDMFDKAWDKDKNDWMTVIISQEAITKLRSLELV